MRPMKVTAFFFIVLSFYSKFVIAQAPDFSALCQEEMKKVAYLSGHWKGEAVYQRGAGSPITVMQEEKVEFKLDGTVLLIEGTGRNANEEIVFNALALLNYHPIDKTFKFKSYLKEGHSTDPYFIILGQNKFEWGFDIHGGGKTKYTITLDPSQQSWNEKGEYSQDGNTWFPFIELKLKKIEE
ncbi:MAG TPA: hypothetical protein VFW11_07425 [Cyclobacteriaceae bacterium]|nr:hypothetical protein [Cyclobacteriaceae bacterium]